MYEFDTELSEAALEVGERLRGVDLVSHGMLKLADAVSLDFHVSVLRRMKADGFFIDNGSPPEAVLRVEDDRVVGSDGHKIRIRIYTPEIRRDCTILLAHGGGWVAGSIETHDALARKMANAWGAPVISVGYRLSPEYKFPIPLNDLLEVYLWRHKNGHPRVVLCGDSVGGNLCAALGLKLADINYPRPPVAQILFYPVLSGDLHSKSFDVFGRGYGLTTEWTKNYIYQYTGAEYDDPRFSGNKFVYPLLEENAAVFPKTALISAAADVLLDAQLEFAKKLKNANVLVYHEILKGSVHGFITYGKHFAKEVAKVLAVIGSLDALFQDTSPEAA
ncbi:MAG: alpha/beta hydrolase [Holosporaceae bacterium]|nr:alpha/beta hydrolase [Holosporaceae bacterium]